MTYFYAYILAVSIFLDDAEWLIKAGHIKRAAWATSAPSQHAKTDGIR
jgi:hypothetical protein